ncbi:DUF7563 family protein [Halorubrum sp. DTA46]|uniref:DUF7563 family protein n=1 Tax=Halorubrum sp. DTA46 TaxID=3402162 RepID=UPI003AACF8E4
MADTTGETDVNRRCSRCGSAVSRQFVRVFGLGGTVHGCLECLPRNRLSSGEAARQENVDWERPTRRLNASGWTNGER